MGTPFPLFGFGGSCSVFWSGSVLLAVQALSLFARYVGFVVFVFMVDAFVNRKTAGYT